ncbi:MAG: DUF721 domain-containing protein [Verrucomicrobiota bacterium]|nr:MAG: DUF721 domain-containing protein [Verrucomicrobiota bacterium]
MRPRFSKKIQNLIADFRGLPRDTSIAVEREEVPIETIAKRLIEKYIQTPEARTHSTIVDQWPLIVGEPLQKFSKPERVNAQGILFVNVNNSTIRQELTFRQKEILKKIQQLCPQSRIQKIVFKPA